MAKQKPILIGCPQYNVRVRGTCRCDGRGRYLRTEDGGFMLEAIQCNQYGGRCMQTLCVLHRFNRRGSGSWYPTGLWAGYEPPGAAPGPESPCPADTGGWYA